MGFADASASRVFQGLRQGPDVVVPRCQSEEFLGVSSGGAMVALIAGTVLLSLLGADMESFNLGRSLFSNEPTFVEEMENPDETMRAWTSRSWGQFY